MVRLVLLRVLESYFGHRWLYLLPTALMTVAALAFYFMADPVYISGGAFFVQSESYLASITSLGDAGFTWNTPAQETKSEFDELLQTDAFIRSVIERTDLEAEMDKGPVVVREMIKQMREDIWLQPLGDNQLRIVASNEDPFIAQQLASSAFETYLQWKINSDRNESQSAQNFFSDLVHQYKDELDAARQVLNDYLESHPTPLRGERLPTEQLQIDRLQAEVDLAATRYASVLEKDENARLASAQAENNIRQTYFLIDAPAVPDKPGTSLKDTAVNMILFVAAGVILSSVGIAGAVLLDRTIRFPIDVHYGLHLPALTQVPDATPKPAKKRGRKKSEVAKPQAVDDLITMPVDNQKQGKNQLLFSTMQKTSDTFQEIKKADRETTR